MSEALRRDLLACHQAALAAVEPGPLVEQGLLQSAARWRDRRVRLVAAGKAAVPMARAAARLLGARLVEGVVVAPEPGEPRPPLEMLVGGHPLPTIAGVAAAERALAIAGATGDSELLLVLLSGGASSLLTLPVEGVELADIERLTTLLMRSGADIEALNTVRKHLDRVKGGRLAAAAHRGGVLSLVLSDVVGDALEVIASGPTVADPSTFRDAIEVLERHDLWEAAPAAICAHLLAGAAGEREETPKPGDPRLAGAEARVVGGNRTALAAAAAEASRRGYGPVVLTARLTGEAREVGRVLGAVVREAAEREAGRRICLLAGGETTVTVTGRGTGGRNLEVALGAAGPLAGAGEVVFASLATDGCDGPSGAAGAVVDGTTLARARAAGLDPRAALLANDTLPFFAALGDLVFTGPTGTNVMDLVLAIVGSEGTESEHPPPEVPR